MSERDYIIAKAYANLWEPSKKLAPRAISRTAPQGGKYVRAFEPKKAKSINDLPAGSRTARTWQQVQPR